MIRAARLDVALYEEVEADTGATGQAMGVVLISSAAAGIGSIWAGGPFGVILSMAGALVGWFVWAFLTYVIGTRLLPEPETRADLPQMLRTIGFAGSPGVIRIGGFLPVVGGLVSLVAHAWMLVAMVIAVRQALDYRSTGRAVAVCVLGFLAQLLVLSLFMAIPVMLGFRAAGA
jgi:hypothetical protein